MLLDLFWSSKEVLFLGTVKSLKALGFEAGVQEAQGWTQKVSKKVWRLEPQNEGTDQGIPGNQRYSSASKTTSLKSPMKVSMLMSLAVLIISKNKTKVQIKESKKIKGTSNSRWCELYL